MRRKSSCIEKYSRASMLKISKISKKRLEEDEFIKKKSWACLRVHLLDLLLDGPYGGEKRIKKSGSAMSIQLRSSPLSMQCAFFFCVPAAAILHQSACPLVKWLREVQVIQAGLGDTAFFSVTSSGSRG